MAKTSTVDEPAGMDKAEIKRHLRMAQTEPVPVAFALGRDGKAIVQFDRRKPGRTLEKQIKDAAPDSKNHRWGTALVDPENAKTVVFTVNKGGGGLAKKLTVALKGSGFSKVRIQLDDGSEVEAHEEEEGEAEAGEEKAAGAAAGEADAPQADRTDSPAAPAETPAAPAAAADAPAPPAAPAPQAPAASGQPNAADLAKDLTGLVKRMLAVIAKDSTQKAALTELATDAQASLKRGDLEQASAGVDIFREAVQDGEAAIAAKSANGAAAPAGAPAAPAPPAGPAAPQPPAAANGATKPNGAAPPAPDLKKEGEEILKTLTNAVKQALPMASAVPGLGELVKTVVPAVQAAVKAGQHDEARGGVQKIVDLIGAGAAGAAGAAAGAAGAVANGVGAAAGAAAANGHAAAHQHREHAAKHAPAIEKAGHVWSATRDKVMGEIGKLEKAFTSALDGHGMMADLTKTLRTKVEGTLEHLDDRLMHVLSDVNKAPDAAERAKHVEQAHKLVDRYQKHVSGDETIKMLDRNPFHPLAIEKTVMASLAALQKTIH